MKRIHASFFLLALVAASSLAEAQAREPGSPEVIFGTDDRAPVTDPAVGRIVPIGCTGWMVSNGAFLTAGHCVTSTAPPVTCPTAISGFFTMVQFNVPLSQADGSINDPPTRDRYPILTTKIQCEVANSGDYTKDWAIFTVGNNSLGQTASENQQAFYRVTNLVNLPPADTSLVRVTGYGVDGPPPDYGKNPPRNKYSQTEQTASGQSLGVFSSGGYLNLRYLVDTNSGNSGSPVILNGSTLTLGIHDGGLSSVAGYNYATSFQLASLANALQAFPGTLVTPTIPGASIFYVDAFSPAYTDNPTGNVFLPFPTLTAAFNKIATLAAGTASMISVVTGGYPETIDETTATATNITVTLKGDSTLVLPVGNVTLWGTVRVPSSGPTTG